MRNYQNNSSLIVLILMIITSNLSQSPVLAINLNHKVNVKFERQTVDNFVGSVKNLLQIGLNPATTSGVLNSGSGLINEAILNLNKILPCFTRSSTGTLSRLAQNVLRIPDFEFARKLDGFFDCIASVDSLAYLNLKAYMSRVDNYVNAITGGPPVSFLEVRADECSKDGIDGELRDIGHCTIVLQMIGDLAKASISVVRFVASPANLVNGMGIGAQAFGGGGEISVSFDIAKFINEFVVGFKNTINSFSNFGIRVRLANLRYKCWINVGRTNVMSNEQISLYYNILSDINSYSTGFFSD